MKATKTQSTKESLKPVDDKKVGKRKAAPKSMTKKEKMAQKDPNKPKRPPSAFFVFLEEFRKTFKEENPNVKGVAAVGKAGGAKWKSLSEAEKVPYEARAATRKAEYENLMNTYNEKQANDGEDEESGQSKSESHDEVDAGSGEGEDEEDEED